jgi:hypothetical protein
VVHAILNLHGDLGALHWVFHPFSAEPARALIPLTLQHIIAVLQRFQKGELPASDVESWADLVQSLGEIGEGGDGAELFQIICELQDYDLRGFPLTPEQAGAYIRRCSALLSRPLESS